MVDRGVLVLVLERHPGSLAIYYGASPVWSWLLLVLRSGASEEPETVHV